MLLRDKITEDIKRALKEKQALRLKTLRLFLSAVKNQEIALRPRKLEESGVLQVAQKQVKQMEEAILHLRRGGAAMAERLKEELEALSILKEYLPPPLPPEQIEKLADEAIQELKAEGPRDMGRVMKALMEKTKGRAEGKALSQTVSLKLKSLAEKPS